MATYYTLKTIEYKNRQGRDSRCGPHKLVDIRLRDDERRLKAEDAIVDVDAQYNPIFNENTPPPPEDMPVRASESTPQEAKQLDDFESLSVKQLRALCEERDLATNGNKKQLVNRLRVVAED